MAQLDLEGCEVCWMDKKWKGIAGRSKHVSQGGGEKGQGEFQERLLSVSMRSRLVSRVAALPLCASALSCTCAKPALPL